MSVCSRVCARECNKIYWADYGRHEAWRAGLMCMERGNDQAEGHAAGQGSLETRAEASEGKARIVGECRAGEWFEGKKTKAVLWLERAQGLDT